MARCTVDGCQKARQARGLCANHYATANYHGALPPRVRLDTPPPVGIPRDELHYLAGIFDGEGSVCILLSKRATARRPTAKYELRVGVIMTHAATVERFHEVFGGRLYLDRRREKTKSVWVASQRVALRCLAVLAPALRVKAPQVEIAVRFMDTFRVENRGRNPVKKALFSERVRLAASMGALNDSHWHQKRLRRVSS